MGQDCSSVRAVFRLLLLATSGISDEPQQEVRVRASGGAAETQVLDESTTPRVISNLADLVESAPGVHLRALGANDGLATLSIRGSGGMYVGVSLLGVPLSGPGNPTVDLSSLPWWPGAQLRLTRSFSPAGTAVDGWGGSLDLVDGEARPSGLEVWSAAGAFGSLRTRAGVRIRGEKSSLSLGLSAERTDGDYTYLDPIASAAEGKDVFATRRNNQSVRGTLLGIYTYELAPSWTLRASGVLAQARSQLAGTARVPLEDARQSWARWMASVELKRSGDTSVAVSLYARQSHQESVDSETEAKARLRPVFSANRALAMGLVSRVETHGTSGRLDLNHEVFGPKPEASRMSGRLAWDLNIHRGRATRVDVAPRIAWWSDGAPASGVLPTGYLSASWTTAWGSLSARAGRSARAPSFLELYGDDGAFRGNADLKPEGAWLGELNWKHQWARAERSLRAEVSSFCTFATDLIAWQPQALSATQRAYNVEQASICGGEVSLSALRAPWSAQLSHTVLHARDGLGRPLPGRAAHEAHGDLRWSRGPWSASLSGDAVGAMAADPSGDVYIPRRVLMHVAGVWSLSPRWSLGLQLRNALNTRASTYAGALGDVRLPLGDAFDYPLPGRSIMVWFRGRGELREPHD